MARKNSTTSHHPQLFQEEIPQMPEGYYSGDKPNPNLRKFVEDHLKENPYDPENDDYDVPAFDKPINSTKATAIYNMHTYWSKKPHDAIREYIKHYTKPGDLVLDPFCGSGGTALAALMEGRKAIAIDRSPAATFITKNYCTPVDVNELQEAFEELKRKVKPEIDWLYETKCDRCGGKATTAYTVYSQVFQCPRCLEKVPLFDCEKAEGRTAKGKVKKVNICPHCFNKGLKEIIRSQSQKFGAVPVLVSYLCENSCKPARSERRHNDPDPKKRDYFEKYDLGKIREINEKDIPYWYPKGYSMTAFSRYQRDALFYYGVKEVADIFTKRNLWALAAIRDFLSISDNPLSLVFSSLLLNASRMQQVRTDKLGHITQGAADLMKGAYYIPQNNKEINCIYYFESRFENILKGICDIQDVNNNFIISCQSTTNLRAIQTNSTDYIFTDPPYADKVQYGELNFIWEAWLGFDTDWHDEEIIVNEIRGKTEEDWAKMMRQAMSECYRVLKPGRWLSLCYHDTSEGTWALIQDIMAEAGFIVDQSDSVLFIDTGQKSYNQIVADKVNRRDLVINFRKPKPEEIRGGKGKRGTGERGNRGQGERTFQEEVREIIREYVGANPGCTKDRIYDEVVSRMVRLGQMEAHDFEELLRQVADEVKTPVMKNLFEKEEPNLFGTHEISRWYLKETQLAIHDEAETANEDKAAEKLGAFMKDYLKKHPDKEGVHYSDLFEHYVYSVKDKPRRQLAEFIPDYFFKTEKGTWRLPDSEEEKKAKSDNRAKGIGRRIKRYLALLEQGAILSEKERPGNSTLAEWIRHCKRAGLYEQGKFLYEKGGLNLDNLSEEAMVNVEEDYQVCIRMLARSGN
ncbi:MAG: hypothetical protein C4527_01160 [Candidatus Omnitrophota bacterium]|jgi:DNA modification methylase|nr:MAG: hypothetical protein C4527_01160 [Candidatus Omnitrophota bacterium]